MQEAQEEWRVIKDFPNYAVSSLGRVKRIKKVWSHNPRILNPYLISFGYLQVQLSNETIKCKAFRVHTLVLEAFEGNCPEGKQANHKNGIRSNNERINLEWVTPSENMTHAYRVLDRDRPDGDKSHYAKLTVVQVDDIKVKISKRNRSIASIALEYGMSRHAIYRIRDGKTWKKSKQVKS